MNLRHCAIVQQCKIFVQGHVQITQVFLHLTIISIKQTFNESIKTTSCKNKCLLQKGRHTFELKGALQLPGEHIFFASSVNISPATKPIVSIVSSSVLYISTAHSHHLTHITWTTESDHTCEKAVLVWKVALFATKASTIAFPETPSLKINYFNCKMLGIVIK